MQHGSDDGAVDYFIDGISSVTIKEDDNCFATSTSAADNDLIVATNAPAVEAWSLDGCLARLKSSFIEAWTGDFLPICTAKTAFPLQPHPRILSGATSRSLSEKSGSDASVAESLCSSGYG